MEHRHSCLYELDSCFDSHGQIIIPVKSYSDEFHLNNGGQGEFWEANGGSLSVEVFQNHIIQLVNQSFLQIKKIFTIVSF